MILNLIGDSSSDPGFDVPPVSPLCGKWKLLLVWQTVIVGISHTCSSPPRTTPELHQSYIRTTLQALVMAAPATCYKDLICICLLWCAVCATASCNCSSALRTTPATCTYCASPTTTTTSYKFLQYIASLHPYLNSPLARLKRASWAPTRNVGDFCTAQASWAPTGNVGKSHKNVNWPSSPPASHLLE